jgi:hypothetical protein
MLNRPFQAGRVPAAGLGLQVVAAIQILLALALAGLAAALWDSRDPVGSFVEAMFWLVLAAVFALIGWGLWKRRRWARQVALVIHWPIFVGASALLALSVLILLRPPSGGIDVVHASASLGMYVLPPIIIASGGTLRRLHKRIEPIT